MGDIAEMLEPELLHDSNRGSPLSLAVKVCIALGMQGALSEDSRPMWRCVTVCCSYRFERSDQGSGSSQERVHLHAYRYENGRDSRPNVVKVPPS